jgi:heavy metal efflux system protein
MEDGRIIDEPDVIQGAVLMRKGAEEQPTLDAIHKKVEDLNNGILPPGVKVVPMLDRSDLLRFHPEYGDAKPDRGDDPCKRHSFSFSSQCTRRSHRGADDSFLSALCLDLAGFEPHSANLLSLGALDFGMVVDGTVVMVENIIRHLSHRKGTQTPAQAIRDACYEVQRPVFYAIAIIITAYMPIFTLQRVEGRLFRPMAWTVAFALLGAMTFSILIAPVLAGTFFRKGVRERRNFVMDFLADVYRKQLRWAVQNRWVVALGRSCLPGGNDLSRL